MPRILYATDGSEGAVAGGSFLNGLPLGADSEIRLLCVLPPAGREGDAEAALTAAQAALGDTAAGVSRTIRRGNTAAEILAAAEELPADLIVVGTRGLGAVPRFFLGSVAERVARHARCPVLLARPLRGKLDRVLIGADGSECAAYTAAWLRQFPLPDACEVRLVAVVTPLTPLRSSRAMRLPQVAAEMRSAVQEEHETANGQVQELAASFSAVSTEGRTLRVSTELRQDAPASGLLAAAEEWQADLLAVGSQGRSGVDRFLLGSVSEKVLHHAATSVLVVRQTRTGE